MPLTTDWTTELGAWVVQVRGSSALCLESSLDWAGRWSWTRERDSGAGLGQGTRRYGQDGGGRAILRLLDDVRWRVMMCVDSVLGLSFCSPGTPVSSLPTSGVCMGARQRIGLCTVCRHNVLANMLYRRPGSGESAVCSDWDGNCQALSPPTGKLQIASNLGVARIW